jgi:hypothetical protein
MDETLEEAGEKLYPNRESFLYRFQNIERLAFTAGAKWQKERSYAENQMDDAYDKGFKDAFERMYTEEEVITLLEKRDDELDYWYVHKRNNYPHLTDWFEEYKKK